MDTASRPLRSFLFAPGNHARRVEKALSLDADAVILDLEDAVAIAEKPATRELVAAAFERPRRDCFMSGSTPSIPRSATATWWRSCSPVWTASSCRRSKARPDSPRSTGCWRSWSATADCQRGAIDLVPIIETARGVQQIDCDPRGGHTRPPRCLRCRRLHARRGHDVEPERDRTCPRPRGHRHRIARGRHRRAAGHGLGGSDRSGGLGSFGAHRTGHTASRARCASIPTRSRW